MSGLLISLPIAALTLAVAGLLALRWLDGRHDRRVWAALRAQQPEAPALFDPAMVAALPEPARRYFAFAIAPGTPLLTLAEIEMGGTFALGTNDQPNAGRMVARQILAGPRGFVWIMHSGTIGGSDGFSATGSWTRFRLLGLLPVARLAFTADHRRSAFGRAVAEALFWTPAALLPGPGIAWEAAGPDTARVTVTQGDLSQIVQITLRADGALVSLVMPRWSNANLAKRWQEQPFGATFGANREWHGYCLPSEVNAGNFFGTPEYFAFYKARVTRIRFPQ